MCINPAILPNGQTFGCRKCWQCLENKIQDWVGRSIAERKTSSHTYAVTLTYGGGDHERATVLTYSDVQKYFKRLRKAGFKFKYLVAGEYGTRKGRAHWHMVLFFRGPAPKHEIRKNFHDPFWGHGHSFWDEPNAEALRYVCKYVGKAADDQEAQAHFAMSKKPPIGSEYFAQMAGEYVKAGLSPKDLLYRFPENKDKEGEVVQHYMHGATARDFLDAFIDQWKAEYGNDTWPHSELVDEHIDKYTSYAPDPRLEVRQYGPAPARMPKTGAKLEFSDPHNCYYCDVGDDRYYWRKTFNENGDDWAWHDRERRVVPAGSLDPRETRTPSEELQRLREARKTPSQRSGDLRSRAQEQSKASRSRLPMVGDPWSPRRK